MSRTPDAAVPCGSCSLCCRGRHLVVLFPEGGDDVAAYKTQQSKTSGRPVFALAFQENGDCAHLVDGACEVYDNRPHVCRKFSCIKSYLETPRAERRRLVAAGTASADVFARGRELSEKG